MRFRVHKLHEASDREALLADLAPRLRAIAGGGVDAALMDKLHQTRNHRQFRRRL
jgi:hypothetical protein